MRIKSLINMIGVYGIIALPGDEIDVTDDQGNEIILNGHGELIEVQPVQSKEQTESESFVKKNKKKD